MCRCILRGLFFFGGGGVAFVLGISKMNALYTLRTHLGYWLKSLTRESFLLSSYYAFPNNDQMVSSVFERNAEESEAQVTSLQKCPRRFQTWISTVTEERVRFNFIYHCMFFASKLLSMNANTYN
jgi:hypothetical protein